MEKMIGNNGRPNMANAQHHGNVNNHGMNRQQQQRPNPNHHQYNNQQPGQQLRRVHPPGNPQQQRVPGQNQQRQHPNPNMNPNRNVNSANMNRPQGQRQPGQQQHPSAGNNMNNSHRPHPQQGKPSGPQGQQVRQGQQGPNAQRQVQPRPNPNSQQRPNPQSGTNGTNGPSNGPPLPNVLPKGWKREEVARLKGISAGLVDVVYAPSSAATDLPAGKKFKSKLELHRYFGNRYDMALLDYRSGKLSHVNWRKARRMKSLAINNTNYASAAKYDNYLNLPIRQTASIFKQSVTIKTNNHKNEPAPAHITNPPANNKTAEKTKPNQLFWEMRFNNLRAVDTRHINEEDANLNHELELRNIPKFKSFSLSNENVLRSVAASWYLNQTKSLVGQEKEFGKNARIFIDREQPLIPQTAIKENELKMQEQRLKQMRQKLKTALKEFECMDYMSLEEIEQAEKEKIEQQMKIDLAKAEAAAAKAAITPVVPKPAAPETEAKVPVKTKEQELIVL